MCGRSCAALALGYSRTDPTGRLGGWLGAGWLGRFSPFNQALRELELGAELALAEGHLARVGLVVVAGKVEKAVQNEHLDFGGKRMALLDGLFERRGNADGQIAGLRFRSFEAGNRIRREGEDICCLVLASELAIEAADVGVCCEQDGDFALEADDGLRLGEKTGQSARRGLAMVFGNRWSR